MRNFAQPASKVSIEEGKMKIFGESGAMMKACLFIVICLAGGGFLAFSDRPTMAQTEEIRLKPQRFRKILMILSLITPGTKKIVGGRSSSLIRSMPWIMGFLAGIAITIT